MARGKKGRPPYIPSEKDRRRVQLMTVAGFKAAEVADTLGIGRTTLYEHYKKDLQTAARDANSVVVGNLYRMTATNPAAAIFWCKTRLGWRETNLEESKSPVINISYAPTEPPKRVTEQEHGEASAEEENEPTAEH